MQQQRNMGKNMFRSGPYYGDNARERKRKGLNGMSGRLKGLKLWGEESRISQSSAAGSCAMGNGFGRPYGAR